MFRIHVLINQTEKHSKIFFALTWLLGFISDFVCAAYRPVLGYSF